MKKKRGRSGGGAKGGEEKEGKGAFEMSSHVEDLPAEYMLENKCGSRK